MKPFSLPHFLSFLFFLFVRVSCLQVVIQPQTLAGGTSLAFWARDPTDPPSFEFDLRFTCASGATDKGLAFHNIAVSTSQEFGAVPIVFPSTGTFTVQAVTSTGQVITTSNVASVVAPLVPLVSGSVVAPTPSLLPPSPSPTTTPPTPTLSVAPSPTSSPAPISSLAPLSSRGLTSTHSSSTSPSTQSPLASLPHSTPSSAPSAASAAHRRSVNLPAIAGGIIGGIVLVGLIAALVVFLTRRRAKNASRRYTFQRDMMVQPRIDNPDPSAPRVTIVSGNAPASFGHDLETGSTESVPPPVVPPKLSIPAATLNPLRHDVDRPRSPITPRSKRNFFTVANPNPNVNPFNTSAETSQLRRAAPGMPQPWTIEAFNPFQDMHSTSAGKQPEMTQVPPLSPRTGVPSASLIVPSPRGPRPSIRRPGGNTSGSDSTC